MAVHLLRLYLLPGCLSHGPQQYRHCAGEAWIGGQQNSASVHHRGSQAGHVQVMADYLKSFDPRIVGLTGSPAQTDAAAKAYRVYVAPQKNGGDDYTVDHSAYFYLMDPQGKFVNVVAGDVPGDQMTDKLRKMMAHPGV